MKRSKSTAIVVPLALALAALTMALVPGVAHGQLFGPTVVEGSFVEAEGLRLDSRRGRCGGVVDAAQSELMLHCGHNFTEPVTLTLFRIGTGAEIARQEELTGDLFVTVELTARTRQDLRRGNVGIRVASADREASGELTPPASATTGSIRLAVELLDADGVVGGSCTSLMLGIGTPFRLFDLYLDCDHEIDGPVVAGLYDRAPASKLPTGPDDLLTDLGDGRTPVLLDWRISQSGVSPVGGFFGGTMEIVITGENRELRAFFDGCLAGGESVCLHNRFQVSARYIEKISDEGLLVPAHPWSFSSEAALFSFTDPEQVEVVVNLDDRCAETGFFALRASGMSEQRPRVTIIDTLTGEESRIELFRGPGRNLEGSPDQPIIVIEPRAFACR